MDVRYSTFPRTEAPPAFIEDVAAIFEQHAGSIGTARPGQGMKSDEVLEEIRPDLEAAGFAVEADGPAADRIRRPVFFGENGKPDIQFNLDAWHPEWRCGLEVEAARAIKGGAVHRDLIRALVMVDLNWLLLAVPQAYRYRGSTSRDYKGAVAIADALYGHSRIRMPFSLGVIGY